MREKDMVRFAELLEKENELRAKWRKAVAELDELISPIQNHLKECQYWWMENVGSREGFTIVGKDRVFRVEVPDTDPARYEAYLPYGIDYTEAPSERTDLF